VPAPVVKRREQTHPAVIQPRKVLRKQKTHRQRNLQHPKPQGKGYGRALIEFLAEKYTGKYSVLQVGTGESPLTVPFYEKCGFAYHHRIKNFFPDHYDHPIYECGVRLVDMVYLQRRI
jgi:GNAT superfamily N-acetyltransferase